MAARDIFTALEERDFLWLWIGSLCSSFAMNMQIVARGWLVYTLTSSPMALAWVVLSFMVPQVLLSLPGGVLADRLPKRRTIGFAQALNFIATLVLAFIILDGDVEFWDFIWFGVFNGSVLAMSMPARQAFVPELVTKDQVFTAMALNTTSWNLSRILGPMLAGFLIAMLADGDKTSHYGVGIVYFVIAGLYLLAALTVLFIRVPGKVAEQGDAGTLADVKAGLQYVWDQPPVLGLIMLSIVPFLFGMPLNTMLPAFVEEVVGGGADDLGFLISMMGMGAITGSLLLAGSGALGSQRNWLIASALAWALGTSLLGASSVLWVAAVVMAFVGFCNAWNMSLNRGMLQLKVDDHMRGRVMSIDIMSHGLMPLGVLPIGMIAERWGVPIALQVSGALFAILIVLLAIFSRSVRALADDSRAVSQTP